MKHTFIIFFMIISASNYAQKTGNIPPPPPPPPGYSLSDKEEDKELNNELSKIEIIGSARVIVKPDIGSLFIYVSEKGKNMKEAILKLEEKTSYYNRLFKKEGFEEDLLKTNNFEVKLNRVYENNKSVNKGYIASQDIMFEFNYSEKTLKNVLKVFYLSNEDVNFKFKFRLSEDLKEKVQREILIQSVKDGYEKAKIVAENSNQKIIKLLKTTYGGWTSSGGMTELSRETQYSENAPAYRSSSFYNKSFTPNDLIFHDTVTMIYIVE